MSLFIPFNHDPESVSVQTSSYSVPAGKYARVTVSLSATAYATFVETGTNVDYKPETGPTACVEKTATFFVPSGTSLSAATTIANTTTSASGLRYASASDSSISSFSVDGTIALVARAYCTATVSSGASSGTNYASPSVQGNADARYIVELFPNLS